MEEVEIFVGFNFVLDVDEDLDLEDSDAVASAFAAQLKTRLEFNDFEDVVNGSTLEIDVLG